MRVHGLICVIYIYIYSIFSVCIDVYADCIDRDMDRHIYNYIYIHKYVVYQDVSSAVHENGDLG